MIRAKKSITVGVLLILSGISEHVAAPSAKAQSSPAQFNIRIIKNEFDPYIKYLGPEITITDLQSCDGNRCDPFWIRYSIDGIKFKDATRDYGLKISIIKLGAFSSVTGNRTPTWQYGIKSVSAAGYGELDYVNPNDRYDADGYEYVGNREWLELKLSPSMVQQGAKTGMKVRVRGEINCGYNQDCETIVTLDQRAFAALQTAMAAN